MKVSIFFCCISSVELIFKKNLIGPVSELHAYQNDVICRFDMMIKIY
jgi:hypothetical protein